MAKKIGIVLCVLLSIVLAAVIWNEKQIEKATAEINREMSAELRPISLEISELEQQAENLQRDTSQAQTGTATAQFLITDLSERSYGEIISPMAEYRYPVGLALSLSEYPGAESCLTAAEAAALAEQGWYFCYAYDATEAAALLTGANTSDTLTDAEAAEALSLWLAAVDELTSDRGLTMAGVICVPYGAYRDSFSTVLQEAGISVVISDYGLNAGALEATAEDGVWFVEATWWRNNSIIGTKLASIDGTGGEIVITMGIESRWTGTLAEWMAQFEEAMEKVSVEVTDFPRMAEVQAENAALQAESQENVQNQLAQLEAQIAELEAQREEIQDRYMEQIRSLGK